MSHEEKLFMKLWNRHVRAPTVVPDARVRGRESAVATTWYFHHLINCGCAFWRQRQIFTLFFLSRLTCRGLPIHLILWSGARILPPFCSAARSYFARLRPALQFLAAPLQLLGQFLDCSIAHLQLHGYCRRVCCGRRAICKGSGEQFFALC